MIKYGSPGVILSFLLLILFTSCGPSKKVHEERLYLRGIDTLKPMSFSIPETVIQKGDMLNIVVYSDDPKATALYNQQQTGLGLTEKGGSEAGSSNGGGYLVDKNGDIHFYAIGKVHLEGLTRPQVAQILEEKLNLYLKNPYVEIRFLNARITILGEVTRPGVINIPEQSVSILDVIALSGDLTVYGRRDNILVVREQNGKRESARLDIRNPNIYKSEYFYLQQNDMVYIEPMRKKPVGNDQVVLRNVTIFTSILSSLAILITLFR